MKKLLLPLVGILFMVSSCREESPVVKKADDTDFGTGEIFFAGKWARDFDAGGQQQTAEYYIYQDSIKYNLFGAVIDLNYVIEKDTFLMEKKQFVGHSYDGTKYFSLFFKNITDDSLTIYKKIDFQNLEEAMEMEIPAPDDTENHGWNTFYKQ
ncbi:MAG: hypothetical protein CSA38_03555 [Flavobacteriales bacterium]|nr:MAG: hypothetical protein CSA38_03555 [Flavobacteriales bacterium]